MIGLKISLAGFAVWFVFSLLASFLDKDDHKAWWYPLATMALLGFLAVPAGLIVWVFE